MEILHIESETMLQSPIGGLFEREGHRVKVAANFAAACAEIDGGVHYDVILLGTLSRSGIQELELIKRTRSQVHRVATPIIIAASTPWTQDALDIGATDAFPQPILFTEMKATIAKYILR